MKRFQTKCELWSVVVAGVLAMTVVGCGKKGGDDSEESDESTGTVAGGGAASGSATSDKPADSTGAMGTLSLGFGTFSSGMALTNLDAGSGVILSDARVSIGSVKIKANKEMDESEKGLKQTLEDEKKARESALEADKEALEQEKEAVEKKYEPQFEGASDAEKTALKEQMRAEQGAVELKLAALEATKDAEMDALEAQLDGNLKWGGPFVYSLTDNSVTPAIPEVQLVDGSYKRIEFKIKPNRTLDGTDPLLNNAIYLAGTATVGGVATPFTASFRVDEEFKLMGAGALKVDSTVTNALTVAFDPTSWFSTVDFSAAIVDASGTIVVSDVSNQEIWQSIRENVKRSTKFGEDEDGDGELKEEESEGGGDEAVDAEEATK